MEIQNPLYKKQGIHLIASIFTIDRGETKVLLVRRTNEPHKGKWALVGGALYNNESVLDGLKREVYEKSGLKDINFYLSNVFGGVDRKALIRMVGISFFGVIDSEKVKYLTQTEKTDNAAWFSINEIPKDLAYDHNEVVVDALEKLRTMLYSSDILRTLFPNGFTMPELQKAYEVILGQSQDRRNFRRKILGMGLVEDSLEEVIFEGKRPAKLYKFKTDAEENNKKGKDQ